MNSRLGIMIGTQECRADEENKHKIIGANVHLWTVRHAGGRAKSGGFRQ